MGQIKDGLAKLESETGIPQESAMAVMYAESGLRPDARNPKSLSNPPVAVGLIQLTKGANLPGFHSAADLERVLAMTVDEQFEQVVIPYYKRFGVSANGASPCKLRMMNFLPKYANSSPDTILATRGDGTGIYEGNWGFDTGSKGSEGGKGYITVQDVCDNTMKALSSAKAHIDEIDAKYSPTVAATSTVTQLADASGKVEASPEGSNNLKIAGVVAILTLGAGAGAYVTRQKLKGLFKHGK